MPPNAIQILGRTKQKVSISQVLSVPQLDLFPYSGTMDSILHHLCVHM